MGGYNCQGCYGSGCGGSGSGGSAGKYTSQMTSETAHESAPFMYHEDKEHPVYANTAAQYDPFSKEAGYHKGQRDEEKKKDERPWSGLEKSADPAKAYDKKDPSDDQGKIKSISDSELMRTLSSTASVPRDDDADGSKASSDDDATHPKKDMKGLLDEILKRESGRRMASIRAKF